jgi:hypothetical protein
MQCGKFAVLRCREPPSERYDNSARMSAPSEGTTRGPEYRLFDSGAVGLAAFICCPLGGAILMAVNYVRLGKTGKGALAFILGLLATALNILIKLSWKTSSGSLERLEYDAFEIIFLFCTWMFTWQTAKEEQGKALKEHIARGGQLGSRETAFFVGLATVVALVVVGGAAVYGFQHRKIIVIGTRDQVIYSGLATKSDATALGNVLKSSEYFQDRGASVLLDKGIGSTTVSFAVQDGVWNQAGILSSFEELGREAAPAVGGLPIHIQLVDTKGDVEARSMVGELSFGGANAIYYEGSATKTEAQALGGQLESMGFFRGHGANVFLTRHEDGTALGFVVVGDAWNDPAKASSFETIVREVAPSVGGLPINMRLVDTQLQVKKEELIE